MKNILIAAALAVGLAAGGFVYAHGGGSGYNMTGNGSYAMMGGGGMMNGGYGVGYGMMGGGGGGMMGGGSGGYGNMGGSGGNGMGAGSTYGGYTGDTNYPDRTQSARDNRDNVQNRRFLDATVKLRRELNDKRFEYQEAQRNPNASRERLSRLQNAINDLQTQLNEKAEQYR